MEKYGVEQDEVKVKTATDAADKRCPACGKKLLPSENQNVLVCSRCGTAPFEVPSK